MTGMTWRDFWLSKRAPFCWISNVASLHWKLPAQVSWCRFPEITQWTHFRAFSQWRDFNSGKLYNEVPFSRYTLLQKAPIPMQYAVPDLWSPICPTHTPTDTLQISNLCNRRQSQCSISLPYVGVMITSCSASLCSSFSSFWCCLKLQWCRHNTGRHYTHTHTKTQKRRSYLQNLVISCVKLLKIAESTISECFEHCVRFLNRLSVPFVIKQRVVCTAVYMYMLEIH